MLSKIVKEQLAKCTLIDTSCLNDSSPSALIKKINRIKIDIGNIYVIELSENLLKPPPDSILVINWNGGSIPRSKYYKAEVTKKLNNMIRITGIEYNPETNQDNNIIWEGWLPLDNITIMSKL